MTLNLASYLAQGYGADEILKFVEKSFPNIGRAISSKRKAGIDAKDILKLIAVLDAKQLKKADQNASSMNFDNPLERANAGAKSQQENPLLQAAKVGGTALAGAAAIGALPLLRQGATQVANAVPNALPTTPKTPYESTIAPSMQEGTPPVFQSGVTLRPQDMQSVQTQMQPKGQPQPQPNISQASTQQSVPSQSPNVKSSQILQEMGLTEKINNLFKAGNNPEQISAGVQLSLTPGSNNYLQNKIKTGEAKPLPEMIQDYITEQQGQQRVEAAQKIDQVTPEQKTAISEKLNAGEKAQPLEKMIEQTERPQKGSIVSTPDGLVGEIKDIKKNEALVESGGKVHKVKVDQIELPNEELIKAVESLLNLPEQEKSSIISSLIYRPRKKEMLVKFHNGESYVYEDVTEEDIAPISEAMGIPVTSGQNIYGKWEKGKQDSRGAALIQGIIRSPKYAKENENKTWEKLETKYDRYKKLYKQPKRKRS